MKRLAVVSADDPSGPTYLLNVTPAALKGLNAYQKELVTRGIPAEVVKTRISFDTDASFPKLQFAFGGFLDEAAYAEVEPLFGSEGVLEITGEKQPETAAAPSTPRRAAPVVVKQPEPEPEPEPEVVEVVEEPAAPKRGFGKAAAAEEKPKAAAKPKAEPKAAVEASDDIADLAAAISGMIDADD